MGDQRLETGLQGFEFALHDAVLDGFAGCGEAAHRHAHREHVDQQQVQDA